MKIKLKKSNLESIRFLIYLRIEKLNEQIKIWELDEKMDTDRKTKAINEESKNIRYWEKVKSKIEKKIN